MRQLDMLQFFKQREVRHATIDKATLNPRVRELLKALDDLASEKSLKPESNGDMRVRLPWSVLTWKMSCSRNTARKAVDEAVLTPFLNLEPSDNSHHTFTTCWLAILNAGAADHGNPEGSSKLEERDVSTAPERAVNHTARRVKRAPAPNERSVQTGRQGVKEGVKEGVKAPVLTPSGLPPILNPGVFINHLKTPGSLIGLELRGPKTSEGVKKPAEGVKSTIARFRPAEGSKNWQLLDRLKAAFARCAPRDRFSRDPAVREDASRPLSVAEIQALYDRCGEIGAYAKCQDMQLVFFGEACRDRRIAELPGALLRQQLFKNQRFASLQDLDEARSMIATLRLANKETQLAAFRERFAEQLKSSGGGAVRS